MKPSIVNQSKPNCNNISHSSKEKLDDFVYFV